ncbi:MAG TPA: peroxiredoxin [Arthrobacter sp.]|nr:peroxiredoxin [Arthrobacter sp.]
MPGSTPELGSVAELRHIPELGRPAPDFELPNQYGEPVGPSTAPGRLTVVVFYPFAFSGICTSELDELRDNLDMFTARGAQVLAVSVDSKYTLRAYAEAGGYPFDLLSDFWPHGAVADAYGVFNPTRGMAERGSFVLDGDRTVRAGTVSPVGQPRRLDWYRKALDDLG